MVKRGLLILVGILLVFIASASITYYPTILFEDFEDDFQQRTGTCTASDGCTINSPWGLFNGCDDNSGDLIFCTTQDGQEGSHTTYALRLMDFDSPDDEQGLWYELDPRLYDDIIVQGYVSAYGLDNNEYCRVWVRDSAENVATLYECDAGESCVVDDPTPESDDYTFFSAYLSSFSSIDLTESQIFIHIGGKQNSVTDLCFFDRFNITSIIIDDPPNVTLNYPENNSVVAAPFNFNFSVNDDINITNCSLWSDISGTWSLVDTISYPTNNIVYNFTQSPSEGSYFWNVQCFDNATSPQIDWADRNYTILVDNTVPVVTLNYPVQGYNTTSASIDFNFSVSDNFDTSLNCSLYIDGVLEYTNSSTLNNTFTLITIPEIICGSHTWNISCTDGANQGSSLRNFVVDRSAPTFNSLTQEPNDEADVDPNVLITFTANITDTSEIETVILQYKAFNESTWTNDSMEFNTTHYINASFTPIFNGTYYYRLWANDSFGNSNTSTISSTSVQYDTSWTRTPEDFGAVGAYISENATLGNLIINNTGDNPINFDLSSDWQTALNDEKVFYNDTEPFTLLSGQVRTLNVTAQVSDSERSDLIKITIAPNSSSSLTTNATLVSYVSGPVLYLKIYSYNISISQSNDLTVTTYVKNLGNDTANNVTLTWSLPTGWDTNSDTTVSISNLSVNEQYWSNISIEVTSSAEPGTKTLSVSTSCVENKSGSDSVSIVVSCNSEDSVCGTGCSSATDSDCSSGGNSGSGSGGSGGGAVIEGVNIQKALIERGTELITSTDTIEIVRGEQNSFNIKVKNIFGRVILDNVRLRIEGYLSKYLEIIPESFDNIAYNEEKGFAVLVKSPKYLEEDSYDLDIIITADMTGPGVEKELVEKRKTTLIIQTLSEHEAKSLLEKANAAVSRLSSEIPYIDLLNELLIEADSAFEERNFARVKEISETILELEQNAWDANQIMESLRSLVDEESENREKVNKVTGLFIDTTLPFESARDLLNLAQAAFERGDFATALKRAKEAQLAYEIESGKDFNPFYYLLINWYWVFLLVILSGFLGYSGYSYHISSTISDKILALSNEEQDIHELSKKAQRDYYSKRSISLDDYNSTIAQHNKRIAIIKKHRIKLRNKRLRILRPNSVLNDLEKESKEHLNAVKKLQKEYFEKHSISTQEYQNQLQSYSEALAEVETERFTLETALELKGKRKKKALWLVLKMKDQDLQENSDIDDSSENDTIIPEKLKPNKLKPRKPKRLTRAELKRYFPIAFSELDNLNKRGKKKS